MYYDNLQNHLSLGVFVIKTHFAIEEININALKGKLA